MTQEIINWLMAGLGTILGFLMNVIWMSLKDLQAADKSLAEKVAGIEVLVAGDYVKKNELHSTVDALFTKLDRIEDKLDRKQDK